MATESRKVGVLVMAYGTPSSPGQIEAFYTEVRRGRPPSAEQLAELAARYKAIGGFSPLSRRTAEQIAGIQQELDLRVPGRYVCTLGNKHSDPLIERAVEGLAGQGVRTLVGVVLAPHYSRGSIGEYVSRATERASDLGMSAAFVEHWHDHPVLIELLAERVMDAVDSLGSAGAEARERDRLLLLVTAHSLPVRVVADGDPYADQLRRTGELVAAATGLGRWDVGWQSAGRTPEPWLGPDILERLRMLTARAGRCRRGLPGRLHLRSPRSPLRPGHRGEPRGGRGRSGLCPHRVAERRSQDVRRAGRSNRRCCGTAVVR